MVAVKQTEVVEFMNPISLVEYALTSSLSLEIAPELDAETAGAFLAFVRGIDEEAAADTSTTEELPETSPFSVIDRTQIDEETGVLAGSGSLATSPWRGAKPNEMPDAPPFLGPEPSMPWRGLRRGQWLENGPGALPATAAAESGAHRIRFWHHAGSTFIGPETGPDTRGMEPASATTETGAVPPEIPSAPDDDMFTSSRSIDERQTDARISEPFPTLVAGEGDAKTTSTVLVPAGRNPLEGGHSDTWDNQNNRKQFVLTEIGGDPKSRPIPQAEIFNQYVDPESRPVGGAASVAAEGDDQANRTPNGLPGMERSVMAGSRLQEATGAMPFETSAKATVKNEDQVPRNPANHSTAHSTPETLAAKITPELPPSSSGKPSETETQRKSETGQSAAARNSDTAGRSMRLERAYEVAAPVAAFLQKSAFSDGALHPMPETGGADIPILAGQGIETAMSLGRTSDHAVRASQPHLLPEGLAQRLAQAAPHVPDRPIEVTLSPEELGRVRMTLITQDGSLTMSIQADRPDTLDLLRRNIETLAQDFRDMGFDDLNFSFGGGRDAPHPEKQEEPPTWPVDLNAISAVTPTEFHPTGPAFVSGSAAGGLDLRF